MDELVKQVLVQLVVAACGAMGTGVVWLAKSVAKSKRDMEEAMEEMRDDIDAAHKFIRLLKEEYEAKQKL